jgi:hypothetical protein
VSLPALLIPIFHPLRFDSNTLGPSCQLPDAVQHSEGRRVPLCRLEMGHLARPSSCLSSLVLVQPPSEYVKWSLTVSVSLFLLVSLSPTFPTSSLARIHHPLRSRGRMRLLHSVSPPGRRRCVLYDLEVRHPSQCRPSLPILWRRAPLPLPRHPCLLHCFFRSSLSSPPPIRLYPSCPLKWLHLPCSTPFYPAGHRAVALPHLLSSNVARSGPGRLGSAEDDPVEIGRGVYSRRARPEEI